MFRSLVLSLLCVAAMAPCAVAQTWARKMFETRSHDFGAVARYSKAEFDFVFKNLYVEEVHIASVRSSCGCTEPRIIKQTLKTHEKGAIRAVFNTRSFTGQRSATLTVTIDRPFYAEVQLSVRGYIRTDVQFNPGSVSFGEVELGQVVERNIAVSYYGRSGWEIVDVRSANPHFEVELEGMKKNFGRINYTMKVRLKSDAPVGDIQDQLTIVTNDSYNSSIELPVDGRVISPVTVSPSTLFLGILKPGQTVKKPLFVRAKKPFKIVSVECADDAFQFKTTDKVDEKHLLQVTFTAPDKPGKVSRKIEIKTDLGITTTCVAWATVKQL